MNLPKEGIERYLRALTELEPRDVELVIAPPYPYLAQVQSTIASLGLKASLSAQDCSDHEAGAFTGEVSAPMLRDNGATFVIVGHSERRSLFGEDDAMVSRKARLAASAGLTPVVCIGEVKKTRDEGRTEELLARQIDGALSEFPRDFPIILAYEPVWAIGTGDTATPEIAVDAHRFIGEQLRILGFSRPVSILYGGSVTPDNAEKLAARDEVDGFLVGGASLESAQLSAIYGAMLKGQPTRR
jgi:triosephosphate isomerase (TIM)